MPISEDAAMLARVMLEAGREPMWVILVVGWYFGRQGRDVALDVIEEITKFPPQLCDLPGEKPSGP
jgi:hypothetical protein